MQVAITSRHGSLRDEVRDAISEKAEKLLTYFERVSAIEVTVDFEKDRVSVEILVDTEQRNRLVASDTGAFNEGKGVMSVFDRTLHKMEQQIRKHKEKLQDHRRDRPTNEVVQTETPEEGPGE